MPRLPLTIGNDIVDLLAPQPSLHTKYIARVFTTSEQTFVRQSPTHLWLNWAAKEAAYKAIKRIIPKANFSPQEFEYTAAGNLVCWRGIKLPCRRTITQDYVAVQCSSNQEELEKTKHWICEAAMSDLYGSKSASAAVRRFAAECISCLAGVEPGQINFSTPVEASIPRYSIKGIISPDLISFSHDGRYLACSLLKTCGSVLFL